MKFVGFYIFLAALTSCLDVRAFVTLRADGSARVKYDLAFDKAMSGLMTEAKKENGDSQTINPIEDLKKKNLPGVRVISESEETDKDGKKHFIAVFELDNIEKLNGNSSKILFLREGNAVSLSLTLSEGDKGRESSDSTTMQMEQFVKAMFANYVIEYDITMPGKIISSNAFEMTDRTAKWKFKLIDVMEKPVVLEIRSNSK